MIKKVYTVDLLRTLNLRISSQTRVVTAHTVDASGTSNVTAGTEAAAGNENGYTLNNYHDSTNKADSLDTYTTANAHKYYNDAKNIKYTADQDTDSDGVDDTTKALKEDKTNECTDTITSDLSSYITLGDCYGKTYLKVTFIIYEAGWDIACFDAVKGQTFNLDMGFTSTARE